MDNLRAAILRPQLKDLKRQCERWNARYAILEKAFRESEATTIPQRSDKEQFIASPIEFSASGIFPAANPGAGKSMR